MKRKHVFSIWLTLAGIMLFLLFPDPTQAGVRAGLELCGRVLIPSLFPVSVLAGCLIQMRASGSASHAAERGMRTLFGLPGEAALPLLLGLLGGFPLGAQLAASAYEAGSLTEQDAARLAGLSNQAGPAFLLGAAGTILGSRVIGMKLFYIQFAAAVLTGILHRNASSQPIQQKKLPEGRQTVALSATLPRCITESTLAMLRLTGAVAFFQAVSCCLNAALPTTELPPVFRAGCFGVLELTGGIASLRGLGLHASVLLPLSAAMIGWGGVCVHLQTAQALSEADIPIEPYLRYKAVQAVVSWILASFLS